MSDLRKKVIKLAHDKPELRKDLLPLLKEAFNRGAFIDALGLRKRMNEMGLNYERLSKQPWVWSVTKKNRHKITKMLMDSLRWPRGIDSGFGKANFSVERPEDSNYLLFKITPTWAFKQNPSAPFFFKVEYWDNNGTVSGGEFYYPAKRPSFDWEDLLGEIGTELAKYLVKFAKDKGFQNPY